MGPSSPLPPVTEDAFYRGRIRVLQNRRGYRFSVDAPILADFILPSSHRALEIGTGCGIISLLLICQEKYPFLDAVEIQPSLADLARRNRDRNRFEGRMRVWEGDFREIFGRFAGTREVFSNPPFFPLCRGKISPVEELRIAKSEYSLSLSELMSRVREILGAGGNFTLVLPWDRRRDLMDMAERKGFFLRRLREIRPYRDRKPNRFLVQLTNRVCQTETMSPLVLYRELNRYSEEMENILTGPQS